MACAEAVFVTDSMAVRAQLITASRRRRHLHPMTLTAAGMVDPTSAMCGSTPAGLAWLVRRDDLAAGAHSAERDTLRQAQAVGAALARRASSDLFDDPGLAGAWQARRETALRYTATLAGDDRSAVPDSVLVSLLHLHHVRAHGVEPDAEARCHRLARAIALSAMARSDGTEASA